MKINKIKRLCLEAKRFVLFRGPDAMWFSDGNNLWIVEGIQLERQGLADLFGLNHKQVDKCLLQDGVSDLRCYSAAQQYDDEQLYYEGDVLDGDRQLAAMRTAHGEILFVRRDCLEPCSLDEADFLLRRDGEGEPLIAVFDGMLCEALLRPARADVAELIRRNMARLGGMPVLDFAPEDGADEAV